MAENKVYTVILYYSPSGIWYNSMGKPTSIIGNIGADKPGNYYVSIIDGEVVNTLPVNPSGPD